MCYTMETYGSRNFPHWLSMNNNMNYKLNSSNVLGSQQKQNVVCYYFQSWVTVFILTKELR